MAVRHPSGSWTIQGTTLQMPVQIRDASFVAAVFLCPAATATDVMRGSGLRPVTVAGRAVSMLACVRYRDSDLGSYDEVGLELAVRGPNRSIGLYTLELPVTQPFTLEAGRDIWGLPKWLASTSMAVSGRRAEVQLVDGDDVVLTVEFDAGPLRLPFPVTLPIPAWAIRPDGPEAGAVLRGGIRLRLEGLRFRPGGVHVELGRHRMAETARRLGIGGRALGTVSARMSGQLGEWATGLNKIVGN